MLPDELLPAIGDRLVPVLSDMPFLTLFFILYICIYIYIYPWKVLEGFEMTQDQFIDLCILLGCDYVDKIRVRLSSIQFAEPKA